MNADPPAAAPGDPGRLAAGTAEELASARLQLLRATRRQLAIEVPRLQRGLYDGGEEWEQLRRIALAGRGAQIRILLHDPAAALREGHRLVGLIQRLPSIVRVRMPLEEADLADPAARLFNDGGGYLVQPDAGRAGGHAALADRPGQAPLLQHFDEVWERAGRAGMLQALDL